MKSTIKLFFIAIILLLFSKTSNAQASEYFHSFSTQINIPIIVDYKKVFQNKENITEKHIPDKQISITFYIKVDDMRFEGNGFFSGMSMVRYSDNDDLKTFCGEVSEDKKTIKYIELTRCFTEFSSVNRESAYPVKTTNVSIRIENIPYWIGKYKFKHGESKITKIEYKSRYFKKSVYDRTETRTVNFVKVNYEKITAYSTPIYVSFKQGKLKTEQVTHVKIEGPDTVCRPQISKYYDEDKCAHIFVAKSDIKAGNFKWETESENIHLFPDKENSARLKIYVDFDPYGADSAVIKVIQTIGAVEYSATHVLHIKGGYYYFWPDCDKLFKMGVITKKEYDECENDLYDCFDWLESSPCNVELEPKYLQFILQESLLSASALADPDFKVDSEKLNWFYKLWDENGDPYPEGERAQLRDFVKTYPCMEKWVELGKRKK